MFKKKRLLVVLLLALVGVAIFVGWRYLAKDAEPSVQRSGAVAAQPSTPNLAPKNPSSREKLIEHVRAINEARDQRTAEIAKLETPDIRQRIVAARLRKWEPDYRALFEKWKVDASTADEVLDIVGKREMEIMELQHTQLEGGSSAYRQFVEDRARALLKARSQIEPVLGSERTTELVQMEVNRSLDERAKALGMTREALLRQNGTTNGAKTVQPPAVFKR